METLILQTKYPSFNDLLGITFALNKDVTALHYIDLNKYLLLNIKNW